MRSTAHFAALLAVILFCTGCADAKESLSLQTASENSSSKEKSEAQFLQEDVALAEEPDPVRQTIFVHICGEVVNPGVYEMKPESRVYELVNQAGGLTETAFSQYLNQAQILCDGQQIYVPSVSEAKADPSRYGIPGQGGDPSGSGSVTGGSSRTRSLVNINTADEAALTSITGIGASRAADIVAFRQQNGSFSRIEDIMKVSGIKEGLFAKIKDQICVN